MELHNTTVNLEPIHFSFDDSKTYLKWNRKITIRSIYFISWLIYADLVIQNAHSHHLNMSSFPNNFAWIFNFMVFFLLWLRSAISFRIHFYSFLFRNSFFYIAFSFSTVIYRLRSVLVCTEYVINQKKRKKRFLNINSFILPFSH